MGFNLLPSALLVAMLSMDKISAGGFKLFARAFAVQVAACAVTVLAFDFDFRPTTTMLNVAASLPLLLAYPLAVGIATYRLAPGARPEPHAGGAQPHRRPLGAPQPHLVGADRVRRDGALPAQPPRPSLLMIDVDHFKQINDRFGHPAGDQVIRSVAAIVSRTVRSSDISGRYGGEEFSVVLPDTDVDGGAVIAERIRQRIEGDDGRAGGRHPVHREHRHRRGAAGRRGRRRLDRPRRPRAVRGEAARPASSCARARRLA